MKTRLCLILLALIFNTASFADGEEGCQKCGQRMITCWDLDILTTGPVTAEDSITWKQLHYASDGYIGEIMAKEQGSCLSFLPACRIGSSANPWQNPCPYNGSSATDTYNTDYEMFGDITGSEGAYIMRLSLVTLKRETVASVTKKFEKASDAKWFGSLAALDLGGSDAGSRKLYDVIHEFEVKKRDAAQGIKFNRTALNASVKFKSEKYKVSTGERQSVAIELKDCDGVPLKSALLELQVAKGRFENSNLETDDNGIAHAVYFAPDEAGTADVKVEYKYRHPSEKLGYATDNTEIRVTKPVEFLNADILVNVNEKVSDKSGDKVLSVSEKQTEYHTKLIMHVYRDNIKSLVSEKNRFDSRWNGFFVADGDTWQLEYDYAKGSEPITNIKSPISVTEKDHVEGYRKSNDEDWGSKYSASFSNLIRFQHVMIKLEPLIDDRIATLVTNAAPPYVLKIRAPLIPSELFGDYSNTNEGSAQRWNVSLQKMVDSPPPFECMIYTEDPFEKSDNEEDKILPPVIEAKQLETFLLNPTGAIVFKLHGSAFRPDSYKDYEIIMDVTLTLSPKND